MVKKTYPIPIDSMLSFISKVRVLAFLRPEYLSTVYLALAVRVFIHNSCRLLFNTRSKYKSYMKVIKDWIWALKAEKCKGANVKKVFLLFCTLSDEVWLYLKLAPTNI